MVVKILNDLCSRSQIRSWSLGSCPRKKWIFSCKGVLSFGVVLLEFLPEKTCRKRRTCLRFIIKDIVVFSNYIFWACFAWKDSIDRRGTRPCLRQRTYFGRREWNEYPLHSQVQPFSFRCRLTDICCSLLRFPRAAFSWSSVNFSWYFTLSNFTQA